jgi:uncharacterized Tic20 family protein
MTEANKDARMWAMLAHISTFSGYVIPFGWLLGPLVVWLIKKEEYPFVDDQGKEALNFQISVFIYAMVCAVLSLVIIGIFMLIGLLIFSIVVTIIAAIKANGGEAYRYPLCIRFIK